MLSRKRGAGIAIAGLAVAVALFVVLREGDDGGEPERPRPPEPRIAEIVVKGGEPVGGVAELTFTRGERIRFRVRSDVADHVHLHGYDVFMDIAAGGQVEFDVPATIEGVFEVELEDRVVPLAEVTVNPA